MGELLLKTFHSPEHRLIPYVAEYILYLLVFTSTIYCVSFLLALVYLATDTLMSSSFLLTGKKKTLSYVYFHIYLKLYIKYYSSSRKLYNDLSFNSQVAQEEEEKRIP